MRYVARLVALVLLVGIIATAHAASAQSPQSLVDKHILILHAYQAQAPLVADTVRAFSRALLAGGVPLGNQVFEELDRRHTANPAYRTLVAEQLRLRYGGRDKIDLIVTLYPEALNFVVQEDLFPHTPTLALYMPDGAPPLAARDRDIVRHTYTLDIAGTLDIALKLFPGTKRLFVVSGAHPNNRGNEAAARRVLANWKDRLEVRYLSDVPLEEAVATVGTAPPDSLVLLLPYTEDITGQAVLAPDLAERVNRATAAPTFGLLESQLGHGIVGGALLSFEQIGARAGELALDILRGDPGAKNAHPRLDVPATRMFDGRQLVRWNLPVSALPPESIIINREYSLWETHRTWVIAVGFGLLLQGLVIAALLVQRRERHLAEEARQLSEAKFAKAFASNPAAISLSHLKTGIILDVNDTALALLGYEREQVIGRSVADLGIWEDPADRRRFVDALRDEGAVHGWELHFTNKAGNPVYVLVSAECIEMGGEPLIVSTFLDVTPRRQAEADTLRLRQDLAHVSRVMLMGELTSSLAHELNQPLTAIAANADVGRQLLHQPTPALGEVGEILTDVVADAERAGEVIQRLRTLLKKDTTRFAPLEVEAVVEEVLALTRTETQLRHQRIQLDLAPNLPKVVGDRIQLQQVLLNLVINAMDAMAVHPSADRHLTIQTSQADGAVCVAVRDTGPGIPTDRLETVFTRFFTTKESGMGMGLAICRTIVEAHRGKIWAENHPDGGAVFCFTLPAAT